ncbi:MAG: hypothetical protein QHJ73_17485, partial [Armatimonadota bacterium]|nr:hypothetical protein [Armatimonadota bacterium]
IPKVGCHACAACEVFYQDVRVPASAMVGTLNNGWYEMLTTLNPEPCRCGRTNMRMAKVRGRTDDMLIVRGVNVFPSQIETILFEIEGVEPHYQILLERRAALDDMTLLVEVSQEIFSDRLVRLVEMENRIKARVHSVIGITPRVKLVEPKTLERSLGKAKRVIDNRTL